MKLTDTIKEKLGVWNLRKRLRKHHRSVCFHNLETAKSIGIIFDTTDKDSYETARSFAKYLAEKKIRFQGIGFADSKEVISFYSTYTGFGFFSKKDVSWSGLPESHNVRDFINEKMDILVDLSIRENSYLTMILALSKASFRVGSFQKNTDYYDLMIDISKNPKPEYLLEQLKHYLTIIQPNKKAI